VEYDNFSVRSGSSSFRNAFRGFWLLIRNERNARIHLLAALIVITLGIVLNISFPEWCLIIILTGLVFMAELFNTALEALSDIVDPGWNEKIRKVKDHAAAAVLVAAIVSTIIGGFIFLPKIFDLL